VIDCEYDSCAQLAYVILNRHCLWQLLLFSFQRPERTRP